MSELALYVGIGLLVGILGGLVGIGGGVAVVPILVFVCKMSQHEAQGTSLGMLLPPIGFFAVYTYYKAGFVNIKIALLLAFGFLIGGLIGARFATSIDGLKLKRVFGLFMLLVSLRMLLSPGAAKKLPTNEGPPPPAVAAPVNN